MLPLTEINMTVNAAFAEGKAHPRASARTAPQARRASQRARYPVPARHKNVTKNPASITANRASQVLLERHLRVYCIIAGAASWQYEQL